VSALSESRAAAPWRPRILVIEDAPENVRFVGRLLKRFGAVHFALGGREGLALARRLKPDLILLDVEMPDLSGYDVIGRLRGDPETAPIPVIFLTGRSDGADEAKGLELGAIDYIAKPFNAAVVLARVRNHLKLVDYGRRLRALNAELERRAATDELTRLPNRRAYLDMAARELQRFRRHADDCSILLLDIDHFKAVNDTYGHDAGDAVLQEVARRLVKATRQLDTVARYGGEEFALLLPKTDAPGARVVAERVLQALRARPVMAQEAAVPVTATVGVTMLRAGDRGIDDVLKRADLALYEGKREGRDRVVFDAVDHPEPSPENG